MRRQFANKANLNRISVLKTFTGSPLAAIAVILMSLWVNSAAAGIITIDENANFFGTLDQKDTNCAANGCGPTAAVNSFVYLQNAYPTIYGTRLVMPAADPNSTPAQNLYAGEITTANTLLSEKYMKCNCKGTGTSLPNFIHGKRNYIEAAAPDTTKFAQQTWSGKNTPPSLDFIAKELAHGEDVEIGIADYALQDNGDLKRVGGHFVTLTGFSFDDQNKNGSFDLTDVTGTDPGKLYYVDPAGGARKSSDVYSEPIQLTGNGKTFAFLVLSDIDENAFVEAVVSESPTHRRTPEPGTLLLVAAGLASVGILGRRKGASPQ